MNQDTPTNSSWEDYGNIYRTTIDAEGRWNAAVSLARLEPQLFVGPTATAHHRALIEAVSVVSLGYAFDLPQSINLALFPHGFTIMSNGAAMRPTLDRAVNWSSHYILFDALLEARSAYEAGSIDDRTVELLFDTPDASNLQTAVSSAYLAETFVVGLSTSSGFWYQAYNNGHPTRKMESIPIKDGISFFVFCRLKSEWFQGLPFSSSDLRKLANFNARQYWSDIDNGPSEPPSSGLEMGNLIDRSTELFTNL